MPAEVVMSNSDEGLQLMMTGRRPLMRQNGEQMEMVVNEAGFPVVGYRDGLAVHSLLRKQEWEELDRAVIEAVKLRQVAVADLRSRGLVQPLGGLGTLVSQWNVASEKSRPVVSMDGRSQGRRDRVNKKLYGVPVPIIHDEYEIGIRELEASRRLGDALDVTEAAESGASVSEELELMLFSGYSAVNVGGNTIYGLTTLPARDTGTAAAYGGGDFGTISNVVPTFLGVLAALAAKRYHGPFGCYIAQTQYHQMLSTYTDGSGQTALQRVEALPQIAFVKPSDFLSDGVMTATQLTRTVIDLAIAMDVTNREWTSPDGMALYYKVLLAMVPRLKTDHSGNAGTAHVTGC